MSRKVVTLLGVAGVGLVGCDGSAALPALYPLSQPAQVAVDHVDPGSKVAITASGGASSQPNALSIEVNGLKLRVHSGSKSAIDQLDMPLADVEVTKEAMPPNGIALRRLRLTLADPVAAEIVHAQDDTLVLNTKTALVLHWSMLLDDGTIYQLGDVPTEVLDLNVMVTRTGDTTSTLVEARCPGRCVTLDGLGDLRDGLVWAEGAGVVSPAAK